MDRHIACLQIPAFRIVLARAADSALRNRPVAVAPMHTPRAVIREISMEAFHEGLQPDARGSREADLPWSADDPSGFITHASRSSRAATPYLVLCTGLGNDQARIAL